MLTYIKQTASSNCNKCTHIMPEPGRLNGARQRPAPSWAEGVEA